MAAKVPLPVQAQEQSLAGAIRAAPVPFPAQLRQQLDATLLGVPKDLCVDNVKMLCEHSPTTASQYAR
jgi:hypothetical protein